MRDSETNKNYNHESEMENFHKCEIRHQSICLKCFFIFSRVHTSAIGIWMGSIAKQTAHTHTQNKRKKEIVFQRIASGNWYWME